MKKCCTKCKTEYPATIEFFAVNKGHKDGLHSWCKACVCVNNAIWYKEHLEECKERHKKQSMKYRKTLYGYISRLVTYIKQRCINENCKGYRNYGGRGICCLFTTKELYDWLTIKNIDPRGLQIHRINNNGDYTLDNIEFLMQIEHLRKHAKSN